MHSLQPDAQCQEANAQQITATMQGDRGTGQLEVAFMLGVVTSDTGVLYADLCEAFFSLPQDDHMCCVKDKWHHDIHLPACKLKHWTALELKNQREYHSLDVMRP